MHEADAEEPAGFLDVEVLREVEGIVVAVPCEEAAVAKLGGEFQRRVAFNSDGEGSAALVEASGVGDAVDLQAANVFEAVHHSFEQRTFMLMNRGIGSLDGGAAGEFGFPTL